MKYLYILQQALMWIIVIFWLYQLIISACALIKFKEKPLIKNKKHRFMVIIPAHNEEAVVGNLIDSLREQDYPKELFDIYVIADNCNDDTEKIAREKGAIVYVRVDETKKTKGYAMQWFLSQKIEEDADYDAFCVFDADNVVDKNFLNAMNKKLCQGEEVVQGYRDIKNPTDSWISAGYAIFYWTMNRFYHLARYNLGLSPLINGTGFMVDFNLVKKTGWNTITLTEDIEFSLKNIAKGRKLGWATDAVVYDEQPVKFKQSWTQRSRWTVGHLQCMKYYTNDLAKGVIENRTLMNFDGLLYILGIPMMLITFLLIGVNTALYMLHGMSTHELIRNYVMYFFSTFIIPILTAIFIMIVDKRKIKPMLKGLALFPVFMASWIVINIKCMIKPNTTWEKIEHKKDVKIKDINE
ncbi:MAG: glycosyltransferase family 2 protein [Clostridia bacterium]|nr:glycosyltransferase family 2 protein [Clostridia bacterium]